MKSWFVTTPVYPYHEVVLEDGSGPTYDISDFEEVDAETRREAVAVAVKKWLADRDDNYAKGRKWDGLCPWTGIRARSVDEVKAEAKAAPPHQAPEWCDVHGAYRPAVELRWYWSDDSEEWGWYGTCDPRGNGRP